MTVRPTPEQVLLLASDRAAAAAATRCADPAAWSAAGCDDEAVWGQYVATTAEPYEVAVDLTAPAFRCSCPSRKVPCKHCLGLLLLHGDHSLVPAHRLPFVAEWLRRRREHEEPPPAGSSGAAEARLAEALPRGSADAREGASRDGAGRDKRMHERSERMRAGLRELDRWLADRTRAGLVDPALADPATWERVAARLVDAQCGGLANRVKRVAGRVGAHARWYEDVLEEMAVLHALAVGGQQTWALPVDLAAGVRVATGLTIAKDDVLAGVPTTSRWLVAGASRTREDRITVQRTWLRALDGDDDKGRWAMVLAFGAVGNEVITEYPVGEVLDGDVHWYPGAVQLRALVGRIERRPRPTAGPALEPAATSIDAALAGAGRALAREPWLERFPVCVDAVPVANGNGRWSLTDASGTVAIVPGFWHLAELVAMAGGRAVTVMGEWSVDGLLPLTVWSGGEVIEL